MNPSNSLLGLNPAFDDCRSDALHIAMEKCGQVWELNLELLQRCYGTPLPGGACMQRVRRQGRRRKEESAGSNRKVAMATSDADGVKPSQTAGWRASRQSRIRKEPAMERTSFVGLDVHKLWINVAVLLPGSDNPVEWRIRNEPSAIRRMLKRISGRSQGDVRYCYEAGPCGYALQRQIIKWSDAFLHVGGTVAGAAQARRAREDRSP
jgi:hypothetical protein